MEQLDAINLAERLRWEQEQQEYWLHLEAASPLEKYPAKQHAKRVQELLGVPDGLIYLAGEPKRNNEDSDMPAPFRQRRYFYYLSGVNEPNCHLVYIINTNTLALFIPRIDPARVVYEGSGSTPAEALDKYDIDQVYYADELEDFVLEWSKYYKGPLYLLHPSQNPLKGPVDEPIDSSTLQPAINAARIIKDEHEIKQIRKANDISSQAHKEILANILRFKNEAQVEGLFRDVCISKLAKEQAYNPIAASGPNAGTLHYDSNNEDFGDRQLMCLDAACEWDLYASDITRTFPLSGSWPSQECKEIYHLVQRMQDACIERVKPGVRYLDLHILAHQVAIAGLLHLGLLHNGTAEEIFKAGTSRAFFPHGLGHHVGLEVHDVGQGELMSMTNFRREQQRSLYPDNFHLPVYSMETCRAPCDPKSPHLDEGMVVTIEPGIYFNTYLLNTQYLHDPIHSKYINTLIVKRYLPVGGVRIEDDILVTSKGYENLTTAPKGEAMMEIIRTCLEGFHPARQNPVIQAE
ncbi:peptidase M24, structural domain-containing protein [Lophiotrema nucula]|uniref:Xaa-Pro aminopeptidase n=1 Tax=Lophiotrema nucula TaxID=690887 RepID=A0A6A5ZMB7_9PLEO|nr:peptidase M24, structural domain-containing protein [Lophiotrema nucula]